MFVILQNKSAPSCVGEGWPTAHREANLGVDESLLPQQIGYNSTAGGSVPSFPSSSVARAGPLLTLAQARRGVTQKTKVAVLWLRPVRVVSPPLPLYRVHLIAHFHLQPRTACVAAALRTYVCMNKHTRCRTTVFSQLLQGSGERHERTLGVGSKEPAPPLAAEGRTWLWARPYACAHATASGGKF